MYSETFYQVLILESDSHQVREALAALAQRNLRGTVATTARAARTFLEQYRWHLVFISGDFPVGSDNGQACSLLSLLRTEHPELPVVMLCSPQSSQAAVAGLRAGCADVLDKTASGRSGGSGTRTLAAQSQGPGRCDVPGRRRTNLPHYRS